MEATQSPTPNPEYQQGFNTGFDRGWAARAQDKQLRDALWNEGYAAAYEPAFQRGFDLGFARARNSALHPGLSYWVANWNLSRSQAAQLLGGNVADMIDATHSSVGLALQAYPTVKRFAGYITGTPDIMWTPDDFALVPKDCAVLSIDQSNQNTPDHNVAKLVKDEESGASNISTAVTVARERWAARQSYTIYCDQAELQATEDAVASAGLPPGRIVAYQYASPTSNPNSFVPGTLETVGGANVDLSVVRTDWLPLPAA